VEMTVSSELEPPELDPPQPARTAAAATTSSAIQILIGPSL
jgi:hypothetical protein